MSQQSFIAQINRILIIIVSILLINCKGQDKDVEIRNIKDKDGNPTKVKAGEPIGKTGKTGSSATALRPNQVHLHFEVRTTKERTGGRVDPFSHISELNTQVIKNPKRENQP